MKIEIATESDIDELYNLIHSCYEGESATKGWTSGGHVMQGSRTSPEKLRQGMSEPDQRILKLTDYQDNSEGKIIACVVTHQHTNENYLEMEMLCVLPDIQGKGIGKKMVDAVEDLGRKLGCVKVKIDVVSSRKELVDWYGRQGFERNGKTTPVPEQSVIRGVELIEMERLIVN